MNYVMAVTHRVTQLQPVQQLLTQVLDFSVTTQGENFVLLENGALNIRLLQDVNNAADCLNLEVASDDLESSLIFFTQQGFSLSGQRYWIDSYREEVAMQGSDNIHLIVYRQYNEDELGIVPELETSLTWHDNARNLTQNLLKTVPVSFRDSARQKIIETAEANAIVNGAVEVDQDIAVRAVIQVTPDFQHERLKSEIIKNGLLLEHYFPED